MTTELAATPERRLPVVYDLGPKMDQLRQEVEALEESYQATIAVADEFAAENDRLRAALEAAVIEIDEAADKMHVLGCNHPGGTSHLNQDKQFMAELSDRFTDAAKAARAAIAK